MYQMVAFNDDHQYKKKLGLTKPLNDQVFESFNKTLSRYGSLALSKKSRRSRLSLQLLSRFQRKES